MNTRTSYTVYSAIAAHPFMNIVEWLTDVVESLLLNCIYYYLNQYPSHSINFSVCTMMMIIFHFFTLWFFLFICHFIYVSMWTFSFVVYVWYKNLAFNALGTTLCTSTTSSLSSSLNDPFPLMNVLIMSFIIKLEVSAIN